MAGELVKTKEYGSKVTTIAEILHRRDQKEGQPNAKLTPAGYRRQALLKNTGLKEVDDPLPPAPSPFNPQPGSPRRVPIQPASLSNGSQTAIVSLSAAALTAHGAAFGEAARGDKSILASDAGSHGVQSAHSLRRIGSAEQVGGALPVADGPEKKPPLSMGDEANWQWKTDQLKFSRALTGLREWGRERKTGSTDASDAFAAGSDKLGDALTLTVQRHGDCEELAFGGVQNRSFQSLQVVLKSMEIYVDSWSVSMQSSILKRMVRELCINAGWADVDESWSAFFQLIAVWHIDGCPTDFDPTDPRLWSMAVPIEAKLTFCLELYMENVVRPTLKLGMDHSQGLLALLDKTSIELERVGLQETDETVITTLDSLAKRIKCVVAFVSRDHGKMGSRRVDAELLKSEADLSQSSLYTVLSMTEGYKDLVAEYWTTIDENEVRVPILRKHFLKVNKDVGKANTPWNDGALGVLQTAQKAINESKPKMRPSQTDSLQQLAGEKVEQMIGYCLTDDEEAKACVSANSKELIEFFLHVANLSDAVKSHQTAINSFNTRTVTSQRALDLDAQSTLLDVALKYVADTLPWEINSQTLMVLSVQR